jgi:hypothetical protein
MIQRGQQAVFMCNGLLTSNRTLEQVFAQELKYLQRPVGNGCPRDAEGVQIIELPACFDPARLARPHIR